MFGTYRTLLALMVVLLHYAKVPFIGQYAVFGFFALSGYLMTLIMQSNYGYTPHGMAAYALNRVLRIFPLYWLCCLIALAILIALGPAHTTEINPTFFVPENSRQWTRNIFLILGFNSPGALISPAWALTVELFYYICIGLGLSRNRQITVVWLVASIAYTAWLIGSGAPFGERYNSIAAASLPFSTGAFIYHWRGELSRLFSPLTAKAYSPAVLFGVIILNWTVARYSGALPGWGFYANFLLCALMIISLFNRKHLKFVSKRLDNWLGELSYPVYLVHYPLGFLFVVIYEKMGFDFEGPELTVFLFWLPPLILISWLLAAGVEAQVEKLRTAVKRTL